MMKSIYYVTILIAYLSTACETTAPIEGNKESSINANFIAQLKPIDSEGLSVDVSKNVIQGIAAFENGWFVAQKTGNSILLINYLDENGFSLFHKRLMINSHGQDLSLEQISPNVVNLYTTKGSFGGTRNTGIYKLKVQLPEKINGQREWSLTTISVESSYDLDYTNATPTLDESKQNFAIRSKNTILIHAKSTIESLENTPINHFELNNAQLFDENNQDLWFQGIAMKDNLIYCLTGNEKLFSDKKIYVYNLSGMAMARFTINIDDFEQTFYQKFEPEGLSFIDNNLYFTVMTKSEIEEGNVKYLYKISI